MQKPSNISSTSASGAKTTLDVNQIRTAAICIFLLFICLLSSCTNHTTEPRQQQRATNNSSGIELLFDTTSISDTISLD